MCGDPARGGPSPESCACRERLPGPRGDGSSDSWRGAAWSTLQFHAHRGGEAVEAPRTLGCPPAPRVNRLWDREGQLRSDSACNGRGPPHNTPRWETAPHRASWHLRFPHTGSGVQEGKKGGNSRTSTPGWGWGAGTAPVRRPHWIPCGRFQQRIGSARNSKAEVL